MKDVIKEFESKATFVRFDMNGKPLDQAGNAPKVDAPKEDAAPKADAPKAAPAA
jgi:hypothetical protein